MAALRPLKLKYVKIILLILLMVTISFISISFLWLQFGEISSAKYNIEFLDNYIEYKNESLTNVSGKYTKHLVDEYFFEQLVEIMNSQNTNGIANKKIFIIPIMYDTLIIRGKTIINSDYFEKVHKQLMNTISCNKDVIYVAMVHTWRTTGKHGKYLRDLMSLNVWFLHFEHIPSNLVPYKRVLNLVIADILKAYSRSVIVPYNSIVPKHLILNKVDFEQWLGRKNSVYFRGDMKGFDPLKNRKAIRRDALLLIDMIDNAMIIDSSDGNFNIDEYVEEMRDSRFCLFFRGDSPSSSRFYDIISVQCIAIIISDYWLSTSAAFTHIIDYYEMAYFVQQDNFKKDPVGEIGKIVNDWTFNEIDRKLKYMANVQKDLLWNVDDSKVAINCIHSVYKRNQLSNSSLLYP